MNVEELIRAVANEISKKGNKFPVNNGYVDCDLGGTFSPSCGEMLTFSASESTDPASGGMRSINIDDVMRLRAGQSLTYAHVCAHLYYEILKRDSNFDFIEIQIHAAGKIEVSIVAQIQTQYITVQRSILDFGPEAKTLSMPIIDLLSLPENGSLTVTMRGISEKNYVYGFRYVGKVPRSLANMGKRVVLLNTLAHKSAVLNRLNIIAEALAPENSKILERTLFIVYDAANNTDWTATANETRNMKIIVLRGPDFSSGGNISLLISLVLRIGNIVPDAISEILIIDDEAQLDAETLFRQDAFITGRKANIVTTGLVHAISGTAEKEAINENVDCMIDCNHSIVGKTTIMNHSPNLINTFISLPYEIVQKCGVPLPFLNNSANIEFYLRCLECSVRIVVNRNLHIWRKKSYSTTSAFYSILNELISNCRYAGMERSHFFVTFMERICKAAIIGNYLLLRSIELALSKFAHGPEQVCSHSFITAYAEADAQLEQSFREYYIPIPTDVSKYWGDDASVKNLDNILPSDTVKRTFIFKDADGVCYNISQNDLSKVVGYSLVACIGHLHEIALGFDEIQEDWNSYWRNFDHLNFWDAVLGKNGICIEMLRLSLTSEYSGRRPEDHVNPRCSGRGNVIEVLPDGFTVQGYLNNNPDVKASGMDAIEHWFNHGQFEGRKF